MPMIKAACIRKVAYQSTWKARSPRPRCYGLLGRALMGCVARRVVADSIFRLEVNHTARSVAQPQRTDICGRQRATRRKAASARLCTHALVEWCDLRLVAAKGRAACASTPQIASETRSRRTKPLLLVVSELVVATAHAGVQSGRASTRGACCTQRPMPPEQVARSRC